MRAANYPGWGMATAGNTGADVRICSSRARRNLNFPHILLEWLLSNLILTFSAAPTSCTIGAGCIGYRIARRHISLTGAFVFVCAFQCMRGSNIFLLDSAFCAESGSSLLQAIALTLTLITTIPPVSHYLEPSVEIIFKLKEQYLLPSLSPLSAW